jgi:ATP-dependent DNA helicase RecG
MTSDWETKTKFIAEAMKEMKYVNMFNQGIRRVQDMLLENGNKEAVFDVSKLTAFEVTIPSTVDVPQDVTQGVTQDDTQDDTQGDTQGGTQGDALDIWIEEQIRKNPKVTTEELARTSKKGLATIKRHIAKLTHIKYVGSGYSGHWEIIENNAET